LEVTPIPPPADRAYRLVLQMENTGSSSADFLYGGQEFEFWAELDGVVVWRWSDTVEAAGEAFQGFLGFGSIQPGETRVAEATWEAPSGSDVYHLYGAWLIVEEVEMTQTTYGWWSPPVAVAVD
jgi:hypothetical protein